MRKLMIQGFELNSDGWNYFGVQEKQEFLGLTLARSSSEATSLQLAYGDDGIVGVLDSGFQTELMYAFVLCCNLALFFISK